MVQFGGGSNRAISFDDTGAIDAFGRMRVSHPQTIWDSQFEYNLHPLYYDQTLVTNGTITHNADHSAADLNVTTDSGSSATLQSFEYFRYQPGKSTLVFITFLLADATTDLTQRVGQFDDNNGFFLEMAGSTVNIVRRTSTSGSVVNNSTPQASWNLDPMDGTGPSRITLDLTKVQILVIDYQWLGVGRIRYGFDIDGVAYYVHQEMIANTIAVPSTTTANLPIRWQILTTGVTAGARTLEAICCSVSSEGGQEAQTGHPFSFSRTGQSAADGVEESLIAIRAAATLNSITFRGKIIPLKFSLNVSTNDCLWRLRYAPTTMTAASWQAPATHSAVETDIATTDISGGTVIDSGVIASGTGNAAQSALVGGFLQRLPLTLDADGTQTIALALTVEGVGGTTNVDGALSWEEVR